MDAALYFLVLPVITPEGWWEKRAQEIEDLEWVLFTVDPCVWLATYMADSDLVARMLYGVEVAGWYEV